MASTEITSRMFEGTSEDITCSKGCDYLGLYGLGGVGKSTLCKAMCSYFQEKYHGMRVCHVELPSNSEEELSNAAGKDRMSRLKSVIQELTIFGTRIVDSIRSESQGLEWLQNRLRVQGSPVFLAVDNVGDSESSRIEARGLVKTVLATGGKVTSKVMVTSRSQAILRSIFHTEKYCKPISRLEAHEARELFLSVAAPKKLLCPLQSFENEIVEVCLGECQFPEDGYVTQQYHPLVLIALGSYFHDADEDNIMKWKEHLSIENKLQGSRESKRVNNILGLNYSSLCGSTKLIFLDVALLLNAYGGNYSFVGSREEVKDYKWRVSFIATLHGLSRVVAERKVKELQRKSLIYESNCTLGMHDLYMEFAQSLVMKEGSQEREWWVHPKNWAIGIKFNLMRRLLLDGEPKIFRNPEQLRQCEKLECLVMVLCFAPKNFSLDLGCLKSLRVLILECVVGVVEIVCNCEGEGDDGYLRKLEFGQFDGMMLKRIPFITHCYNLKSLSIELWEQELGDFIHSPKSKIFEKCKALEVLCHRYMRGTMESHLEAFLSNASNLQSLRVLKISLSNRALSYNWPWERPIVKRLDVSPLGHLPSLCAILLRFPYKEVQGLDHLSRLITLKQNCSSVVEFNGVDQLLQLRTLDLDGCQMLCTLPNLDIVPNLQEVCLNGCHSLEDSIRSLKKYQEIGHHKYHKCHQPNAHKRLCEFCKDLYEGPGTTCVKHAIK